MLRTFSADDIEDLLRDAQPTAREFEGRRPWIEVLNAQREGREIDDRPDPRKAREAAQACHIARVKLVRLYRNEKKARRLSQLRPDVRSLVEDLIRSSGGKLPRLKLPPGRPRNLQEKMLMHLAVLQELEAVGCNHGNISKAIKSVAGRYGRRHQVVRDIYYNRHQDWLKALNLTMALREALQAPRLPKQRSRARHPT